MKTKGTSACFPLSSDLVLSLLLLLNLAAALLRTLQMPFHLYPSVAAAFASSARDLSPGFRTALPSFAWRSLSEVCLPTRPRSSRFDLD